jgi:hypothetical protein
MVLAVATGSTVGQGDIVAQTGPGRIVKTVCVLAGLGVFVVTAVSTVEPGIPNGITGRDKPERPD